MVNCEHCHEPMPEGEDAARCQFCGRILCNECDIHAPPEGTWGLRFACKSHVLKVVIPRQYKEQILKKLFLKLSVNPELGDERKAEIKSLIDAEIVKIKEGNW